jgi:hypothetical protein
MEKCTENKISLPVLSLHLLHEMFIAPINIYSATLEMRAQTHVVLRVPVT